MKLWILVLLLLAAPVFADLDANATISPRFVDTSVINQTFVYTITPLNESLVNRTIITIPSGYSVTKIINVTVAGESCTVAATCATAIEPGNITINFTSQNVNISFSPVIVTFTANTSSSGVAGNFSSVMNSSAFHNQSTENAVNSTLVTTLQMINATTEIVKGTAIINGTDHWEFKFVLAFNNAVDGLIQFKMNNWIDNLGKTMNIVLPNGTSYATLRNNSGNFSDPNGKIVVNTTYPANSAIGINRTGLISSSLYLRMQIPVGANLSDSWSTTYNFLFRATP